MRKYTYRENGFTFERIDKTTAKKAYLNGLTIIICPVNLRPGEPYHPEQPINRRNREQFVIDEIGAANDFNNLIASFEYYNCRNNETGKYTAFYIPIIYTDRFNSEPVIPNAYNAIRQYDYKYMEGRQ